MSPQKPTKNRKHRGINWTEITKRSISKIWDPIKKYWVKLGLPTFIVVVISLIGPWNDSSLASEEKTPRGHIEIATYDKKNSNINVKFCHDGGPEIWFGDKYPDFNLFVDVLEKDFQLPIKKISYPTKSLKSNECANIIITLISPIQEKVKINVKCSYNGTAWFTKCSKTPIDSIEVSLLGNDIILVDATGKNDKIELNKLRDTLENYGARVLLTQSPGKGVERDGVYRTPQERAVIFSEQNHVTISILSTIIKENIEFLPNDALSGTLNNLLAPVGGTDYALLLNQIGDCGIKTDLRENICDFEQPIFDSLVNSKLTHLFTRNLVNSMNEPIVIIIPTTTNALNN